MHARTITLDARPELLDPGIAFIRDTVFDQVTAMPGCVGMSFVADRSAGRCIATTAWESEEAMHRSDEAVRPIRQQAAEVLGATPRAEEWEIVVLHRNHRSREGACVRSTWIAGHPARIDQAIDVFKTVTLPPLDGFDGFCSASLLVNRSDGRALITVAYDSREALERTREQADALRAQSASDMGGTVADVREFDLVIARLHAPEMV